MAAASGGGGEGGEGVKGGSGEPGGDVGGGERGGTLGKHQGGPLPVSSSSLPRQNEAQMGVPARAGRGRGSISGRGVRGSSRSPTYGR